MVPKQRRNETFVICWNYNFPLACAILAAILILQDGIYEIYLYMNIAFLTELVEIPL